ncbi:MAG: hypothetical protein IPM29_27120 [Planctomycetes bacterium]|nr:hypothetical protein [Planctomycetota bacterium]
MASVLHRPGRVNRIAVTILVMSGAALGQRALEPLPITPPWAPLAATERNPAGELTARGQAYAARFRPGVVAFASAGVDGGRSAALEIELGEIRREDGTRLCGVPAGIDPVESGDRAEYDRGNGVLERFDARAEGLEWSLVFEQRPPGSGDLVVEASLCTELRSDFAADGTLRLRNDDGNGVTIGGVTGVDARGARVDGHLRLAERTLQLVLPGTFVDAASYPLTLDPLIGSVVVSYSPGYRLGETDCVYDSILRRYALSWVRPGSLFTGNTELWSIYLDSNGQPLGMPGRLAQFPYTVTPTLLAQAIPPSINNTIAFVFGGRNGLFVWNSGQVTTLTTVPILKLSARRQSNSSDIGIAYVAATAAGTPIGVYSTSVTLSSSTVFQYPHNVLSASSDVGDVAISRMNGRALVAWSEGGLGSRVELVEVNNRGVPVYAPLILDFWPSTSRVHGGLSMDGDEYGSFVVWERLQPNSASLADLYGRLVFADPGHAPVVSSAVIPIATDPAVDESSADVGWLGSKFAVFWRHAGSPYRIEGREFDGRCTPCGLPITITHTSTTALGLEAPHIAPQRRSGVNSHDALVLFSQWGLLTTDYAVLSTRFSAFGAGGSIVSAGGQCGSSRAVGTIGTDGPFAIGNHDFRVTLSGSTGSAALALVGVPGLDIPCGACLITQPVLAGGSSIAFGAASYVFEVPCLPAMLGSRLTFQWLVNEPSVTTSCVPGWGATQQLHARLGY